MFQPTAICWMACRSRRREDHGVPDDTPVTGPPASSTGDPELNELRQREALAAGMGGAERVARQHAGGRLTVRERIERMLDPGSFHEVGAIAGKDEIWRDGTRITAFLPANCVFGRGTVDGRPVVVAGDDFTVRGGSADASIKGKPRMSEQMAAQFRMPIIRLIEGSGGGGSVKTIETTGRANLPGGLSEGTSFDLVAANMGLVPVVALGLGSVAGLGAARLAASHYSVMVKEMAAVFVAGPPVVERLGEPRTKQELGGWEIQIGCGAVDDAVDTEDEAFAAARRFLVLYAGLGVGTAAAGARLDDPARREEADHGGAARQKQAYHMRRIIEARGGSRQLLRDGATVRAPGHHRACAAGRLAGGGDGGRSAVSRRRVDGGCLQQDHALRRSGADVSFADRAPGGLPGLPGRAGGGELGGDPLGRAALSAINQTTVPWCASIVRNVYGVGGLGHVPAQRLGVRYAWPSASWGSLPLEGGVEAAYRAEIDAATTRQAKLEEIEARLNALRSPFRTAEAFWVEEIIDPRDTRRLLCEFAEHGGAAADAGGEPVRDAAMSVHCGLIARVGGSAVAGPLASRSLSQATGFRLTRRHLNFHPHA